MKIDDPITNEFSDEVHVYLDVFGPLPLHWISTKLYHTLIIAPDHSWMMDTDPKLR